MKRAGTSLRERREATVLEDISAENRHDVEATIATFHSARYEVNGVESNGEEAVRDLLNELMAGFPDFQAEVGRIIMRTPRRRHLRVRRGSRTRTGRKH
jgi:hypothetical protein